MQSSDMIEYFNSLMLSSQDPFEKTSFFFLKRVMTRSMNGYGHK